ncbi:MAG: hypothetical protein DSY80_08140, partial [Desulfocapsa sp.]
GGGGRGGRSSAPRTTVTAPTAPTTVPVPTAPTITSVPTAPTIAPVPAGSPPAMQLAVKPVAPIGSPPVPQFTDIRNSWGKSYIQTIARHGYMTGFGGVFSPNDTATRAELSKVLAKHLATSAEIASCRTQHTAQISQFTDIDWSDWYGNFVCVMLVKKIFVGVNHTTFAPHRRLTRAEAAVAIARAQQPSLTELRAGFTAGFNDVQLYDWFNMAVNYGVARGYLRPATEHRNFQPHKLVTRTELAKMIVIAFGLQ